MLEAINRLKAAVDEMAIRNAAQDLGALIGTTATNYKTPAEIDAMTLAQISTWCSLVEAEYVNGGEG